jgi:hypothetical protein
MGILFGTPTYKSRKQESNFDSIRDYGGLDCLKEGYTSSYFIVQFSSGHRDRRNSDFDIKTFASWSIRDSSSTRSCYVTEVMMGSVFMMKNTWK